MACDLQRLAALPIKEDYKIALLEYFQKPENAAQCEELSQASDEQILALIQNMDQSIAGQGGQGQPTPGQAAQQPVQPQAGIGAMPPAQPAPPQPTGAMPSPMDMPQPGAPGGINMLPKRY